MSTRKHVSSYDQNAPTPAIRSRWIWEANKPFVREAITVIHVEWNGEEWWVKTIAGDRPRRGFITGAILGVKPGKSCWNSLSRFWEAVTPIPPGAGRLVMTARQCARREPGVADGGLLAVSVKPCSHGVI